MKKLYFLIGSLTLNSICKLIGLIIHYLDLIFIERQADNTFDDPYWALFHPYSVKFTYIGYYLGLVKILCMILIAVFLIINFINLIKKYQKNDLIALGKYAKTIKIGLIPFWALQFLYLIGNIFNNSYYGYLHYNFYRQSSYFHFFMSYLILLFSSIFSIGYLRLLFKNNKIDKKIFIKNIIMQLFFIYDIISIVGVLKKNRIQEKIN